MRRNVLVNILFVLLEQKKTFFYVNIYIIYYKLDMLGGFPTATLVGRP